MANQGETIPTNLDPYVNSASQTISHNHATTSVEPNSSWLMEFEASNHVTLHTKNMTSSTENEGPDQLFIGDESALPITQTSSISLTLSPYKFSLKDVLCVPTVAKKLNICLSILSYK